jgi:hypothetical protein
MDKKKHLGKKEQSDQQKLDKQVHLGANLTHDV